MIHFAAAFDKNYLARALAMRRSITDRMSGARFWFLCLDDDSKQTLESMSLPDTEARSLADMNDNELMATRSSRNPIEFAMTAKPAWISYLMHSNNLRPGDQLILIDADIMFYADPAPFLASVLPHSISITPHRFPAARQDMNEKSGIYNSGLIFFTKDAHSLTCTAEWRRQCIDWCYLRYEPGLYTDQRYLNDWPTKYAGVYVIPDKGVNTGTWNIHTFRTTQAPDGSFYVDGEPLVCFHFHGLKLYLDAGRTLEALPVTIHHPGIYAEHLCALRREYAELEARYGTWTFGTGPRPSLLRLLKQRVWKLFS